MNTKRSDEKPPSTPPPYPGYPPPYWYYPPEQEGNLLDYWDVIVKHKLLIILITLLSTGIATAAALFTTPIYRAETLLAPVTEEQSAGLETLARQFGDLAVLTGINANPPRNTTDEATAALKSRALTDAFIKEEKLMPILFVEKWDRQNNRWMGTTDVPSSWDAYKLFNRHIRFIDIDKRTRLVTLSIEWTDPVLAAKWANKLVQRVNTARRSAAINEAENSIAYLKQELVKTSVVEIQQAIYRLIEAQTKTKMLASTREEYAFKVIDPAIAPEEKSKPKRIQNVGLGFGGGLVVSIFFAFVIQHMRDARSRRASRQ